MWGTPSPNSARDAIEPSGNSRSCSNTSPSKFSGAIVPRQITQRTPSKQASNARNSNSRTTNTWPATVAKPNAHFLNLVTSDEYDSVGDKPTFVEDESLAVSGDVASVRRALFDQDNPPAVSVTRDASLSRPAVRSALDTPNAPTTEDEHRHIDENVLELISPEVVWDDYMQGTSDSGITENDAESFSHDTLSTNQDTTNETEAADKTNAEESQLLSHNEAAFTGSVVDALSSAFAANDNDSGIGASLPPSPAAPPTAYQSLFLSDDESGPPEPAAAAAVVASRPVPTREPQANLRVARPYLNGEDATYAYDKTTRGPALQAYVPPPASTEPPEPVILRRGQYTSVTEHFLQRVEEWFGPSALKALDQEMLDGPSKNIPRKGKLSSTQPKIPPVPAMPSRTNSGNEVLKRKRVASSTPEHSTAKESRTIKKPRILVDSDEVSSVDSHIRRPGEVLRSTAAPDMGLLRKFMDKKLVPTDEEVNKVNLLISRLNLAGDHDVYEGKTSSNAYFRIMVPRSLVTAQNLY
ncbi:hypothetical protein CPB85DRAFT_1253008 [Mucidula mucida]|nr:hypothetical protein CPB85DRAFT_1253008 [Mucidula mucida]